MTLGRPEGHRMIGGEEFQSEDSGDCDGGKENVLGVSGVSTPSRGYGSIRRTRDMRNTVVEQGVLGWKR